MTALVTAIAKVAQTPFVKRQKIYIETLKQFGWEPDHPPSNFKGVYSYTLVEYAVLDERKKTEELLRIFDDKDVRDAFYEAFKQWTVKPFWEAIDRELNPDTYYEAEWQEWNSLNVIGRAIREQGIDMSQEVRVFFFMFVDVVRRSQTPKEQMQTVLLERLQQDLAHLRQQLAHMPSMDILAGAIADQITDQVTTQLREELQAILPGATSEKTAQKHCAARVLAEQMDAWFRALSYGRESYEHIEPNYWEWMITIPARRGFDRILVRCVVGEAGIAQLEGLRKVCEEQRPDEGWLISTRPVAPGAKQKLEERDYRDLYCYTLDEVIDQVADFEQYLSWLEGEITQKGIDADYIPLGCSKDEVDPESKQKIGVSHLLMAGLEQFEAMAFDDLLPLLKGSRLAKTVLDLAYPMLNPQTMRERLLPRIQATQKKSVPL